MQDNQNASKWLMSAVREGRIERVKELINSFGLCSSRKQPGGYGLLLYAVWNKHTEIANLLLANGCKVNSIKKTPVNSPLHHAARNGEVKLVHMLLDKGAIVDGKNDSGKTPLHNAVISRKMEIVESLLNKGANVNSTNKSDITPLHLAVEFGTKDILKLLLRSGANVDAKRQRDGWTHLHIATKSKQIKTAKLLISCGADVNTPDKSGKTPIFYATDNGDLKMTKLLIANKANVKDNPELLTNAAKEKYREIIEVLLQHGADVNSSDKYGRTALHFTALDIRGRLSRSLHKDPDVKVKGEIAKLLLSRGANVNAETKDGITALCAAAHNGYANVVKTLLEYNADVNLTYKTDIPLFSLFVEESNVVIKTMPVNKGADVNTNERNNMTALHIATHKGHKEVVELLLKGGCKIDSKIRHGITPLHIAVQRGNLEIVKVLLTFGVCIDSKDQFGATALHIASKKGYSHIVIALLEHGSDITIMNGQNATALKLAEDGIGSFYERCNRSDSDYEYFVGLDDSFDAFENYDNYHDDYCDSDGYSYVSVEEYSSYGQNYNYIVDSNSGSDDDYDYDPGHVFYTHIDREADITQILKWHMIKVKTANLYASNEDLLTISSDDEEMSRFQYKCEKEVASMKSERFGNSSISFYDVLTKGISQLAIYAGNKSIVQVFKSDDWKVKFPIYDGMINCQFRKGRRRKELLDQGSTIFQFFFNNFLGLPYYCTEKIFSYLSDEDLRTLMDACRPISISSPT